MTQDERRKEIEERFKWAVAQVQGSQTLNFRSHGRVIAELMRQDFDLTYKSAPRISGKDMTPV